MKYYYLAFIPVEEPKGFYAILSPDFPEITTQGENLADCMDMGADALRIVAEEYAKARRALPEPSDLEQARARMARALEELGYSSPLDGVQFQLFGAPEADATPVRISATFPRYALDTIDAKARRHGMTRSGFLLAAAQAYQG